MGLKKESEIGKYESLCFGDIMYKWLEEKQNSIKTSTYSNYLFIIEKYLHPNFSNYKLKDLVCFNFNDFIRELMKTLSSKFIRDILCVLKSVLHFAEQEYNLDLNIKRMSVPKLNSSTLAIFSNKEKHRLERYCMKNNELRTLGIFICLNTGLRIGEICALKWNNVDLDKKVLYVKSTLQRIYDENLNKTKVIIDVPKTSHSVRAIPISKKLYEILLPLKKLYKPDDFVLSGRSDKFIEPRNFQYNFKITLKACNIKSYNFHILRHTFATDCIQVGMDVKSLSELLGHANVNITLNRYVHSSYKIKKKYLERL
ncbi:MAG: site-specific integrase [Clostridia bacterium]|nr:site-specific integrase [Clostridia bacterium]